MGSELDQTHHTPTSKIKNTNIHASYQAKCLKDISAIYNSLNVHSFTFTKCLNFIIDLQITDQHKSYSLLFT